MPVEAVINERQTIEEQLQRINARIKEAESRLGAHSIKPVLMQQLFELEEQRDAILAQLQKLGISGA